MTAKSVLMRLRARALTCPLLATSL